MFIRIPLTTIVIGILYFLLVSCQPDTSVTPAQSRLVSTQNVREGISPNFPQRYQLTKHGAAILSYFDDGRLRKVVHSGISVRGSLGIYTLYSYSAQSIVAKTYDESTLRMEIKYLLDPGSGRCNESQQTEYIPYGPNATLAQETNFLYQYNANGQLKSRTNKKYTYEKTDFSYNADGDLNKVIGYDKVNGNPGAVIVSEAVLSYDQPTGDPMLSDLYPLNNEVANLPDTYLRIFGKPSKHLVKLMTEKYSSTGRYYTYTLNPDGYVTTRNTYTVAGGTLVNTQPYEYLVTNLGINP